MVDLSAYKLPDIIDLSRLPALPLSPGYGMRPVRRQVWSKLKLEELMGYLMLWELPRRTHRYVMPVDVSAGIGQDRSVITILRVGTAEEPEEEVAQYVSDQVDPIALARIADPIGRLYADADGVPAMAAVECNNHGMLTQAELTRHLGYSHFFIWQYEDARNPNSRYSSKIGWYTTQRTRPIIMSRFIKFVREVDPATGRRQFIINSPFTIEELRDLQVPNEPGAGIYDAAAAPGGHDDCIMADCIGLHVSQTLYFETSEPLDQQRERKAAEDLIKAQMEDNARTRRDYANTAITYDQMMAELEME